MVDVGWAEALENHEQLGEDGKERGEFRWEMGEDNWHE